METATIIAILNSSFVLAVFAFCAPRIGRCLNRICPCFGGPANNEQEEVLLNNGQANNGQQEGRTNNGQEGGQTNNGQEGGQMNNGQEGGQTNNGQQGGLLGPTNNGQEGGQTNNGQEGGQTNNGQQGGLLGPTNNDQPAGGEKTTGQSSSRNPANSSQLKDEGQSSGSHMLSARALKIEHADKTKDTEYWQWIDIYPREPRFKEALKLKYVYLLDITAWMNFRDLTSKTNYAAYLIFRTRDSVNLDTIQKAWVSVGGVKVYNVNDDNVCIQPTEGRAYKGPIGLPVERDGWMELKLGEFYCDIANDVEVEITIKETNTARENTKTGLIVAAIEVRPA